MPTRFRPHLNARHSPHATLFLRRRESVPAECRHRPWCRTGESEVFPVSLQENVGLLLFWASTTFGVYLALSAVIYAGNQNSRSMSGLTAPLRERSHSGKSSATARLAKAASRSFVSD